jgi:hypothetical protein
VRAERKELGERADGLDVSEGSDAHETVGIQVVAEEDPCVAVIRTEEARPSVVQEIALVDRFEPDREAVLCEL